MYKFLPKIFIIAALLAAPWILYSYYLIEIRTTEKVVEVLKRDLEEKGKDLNSKVVLYENSVDLEKIEKEMKNKYKMKIASDIKYITIK